jgi:NTP pyrophosphatase (non-canonical NTP hydrolase)
MTPDEFQQASRKNGDNVLLNEYQAGAISTAIYPGKLAYPVLGLCGEAGELIAACVHERGHPCRHSDDYSIGLIGDIMKEIGDVLWYVANTANDMDVLLSEVMQRKAFDVCLEMWDVDEALNELPVYVGVIAENVKKTIRDNAGVLVDGRADNIMKALNKTVLWLERMCSYYGLTLAECAQLNLDKLRSRQARGALKGDGDDR